MTDSWANFLDDTVKEVEKVAIDDNKTEIATPPPASNDAPQDTTPEKENKAESSLFTKVLRSQLIESTREVEVQQKDPNSPLYSVKTFEELNITPSNKAERLAKCVENDFTPKINPCTLTWKKTDLIQCYPSYFHKEGKRFENLNLKQSLLEGVYGMGFNKPSKIQETALPMLMCDPPQNMIAQSQSGTGKTAAFVLATLSRIEEENRFPQALILAPTYELAIQIGEVIDKMASRTNIKMEYAVRGKKLARGTQITAQIIVGTPGTTVDWIFKLKFFDPKKLKAFVLDEADVMVSQQGHQDQSTRIKKVLSPQCQCMLFSATYDEDVMKFAQTVIPDPILIRLKREEQSLDTIKQFFVTCNSETEKYEALCNIYGTITIGQTMIFCKLKRTATWLQKRMTEDGHAVAMLTSDITIEERLDTLNRYREGREKVLITTNVCARGIDVEQVTVVINFDLPTNHDTGKPDMETYLHRIGRTGRFGKKGIAINFVDSADTLRMVKDIQNYFNKEIMKLNTDDTDEIEGITK